MRSLQDLAKFLPSDLYDLENSQTNIHTLFASILKVCQDAESETVTAIMSNNIATAKGSILDSLWGALFELPREADETYVFSAFDDLTDAEKNEVIVKDNRYRNRLILFVDAINSGPTIDSIKKVVMAACGLDSVVLENYVYQEGSKTEDDPEPGKYEFTIKLGIDETAERAKMGLSDNDRETSPAGTWVNAEYELYKDERTKKIQHLVNKIKPASTVYVVTSEGISQDIEVVPELVEADSEHFKEVYSANYVDAVRGFSSELPREVEKPNCLTGFNPSSSFTINAQCSMQYNANGNVPAYFLGKSSEAVWGHWAAEAFDGNGDTYWLSTSDDGPNEVYSYEYVQGYTGGQYMNEVRIKQAIPADCGREMLCFVSVHDGNNWIGGSVIPYEGYVAHIYPSGEQWDCGARIPYCASRYLPADENYHTIPVPPGNYHYVRITFTNLHYWGNVYGSTFNYRAGVKDFQVWTNNYISHPASYAIDGDVNSAWWSGTSSPVAVTLTLNGYANVTRMKIKTEKPGVTYYITNPADNSMVAQGTLTKTDTQINFPKTYTNQLILSLVGLQSYPEGNMIRISNISVHETYFVYDYPATNVVNHSKNDYWISKVNVPGKTDTEWLELYLSENGDLEKEINRVTVYSPYDNYTVSAFYLDGTDWIYIGQKIGMPKVYTFEITDENGNDNPITTRAIRLQIQNLVTVDKTEGLNVIQGNIASISEVQAWKYEKLFLWGPENTIDDDDYTFWLSEKRVGRNTESYLIFTLPDSSAIGKIFINPATYGVKCDVYISNDKELNEKTTWSRRYHENYLTKQNIRFTKTLAKFVKLVFSNLQMQNIAGYYDIADYEVKSIEDSNTSYYHAGVKTVSFFDYRYMNVDVDEISEVFVDNTCISASESIVLDTDMFRVVLDNNTPSGSLTTITYTTEHPVSAVSLEANSGVYGQKVANSDFSQSTPTEAVRGWEISDDTFVSIDDGGPEKIVEITTTQQFIDYEE